MTAPVSVVVPVAGDGAARDTAWAWCRGQYPDGWEVLEAPDPGPGEWSKGRAVNPVVARAAHDLVLVADCDLWLGRRQLERAVAALERHGFPWLVPHDDVYRLSPLQTAMVIVRPPPAVPYPMRGRRHRGPAGGGFVLVRRGAWDAVGGLDERFAGWGGEDISLARALDTVAGPHARLRQRCWHLWHPPMPRRPGSRASWANEALAGQYAAAAGDREAMLDVIGCRCP